MKVWNWCWLFEFLELKNMCLMLILKFWNWFWKFKIFKFVNCLLQSLTLIFKYCIVGFVNCKSHEGRFAKVFPSTFPTGYCDLYQERIRNDVSVDDGAQHVFRHYDGSALRALRGHRAIFGNVQHCIEESCAETGSTFT